MERIPSSIKHPKEAYVLAVSKLFDRMGYYGFRGLFILFLIKGDLHFTDDKATYIYAYFTGAIYLFQLFGAILGDYTIANKKLTLLGGIIFSLGLFVICIPSITTLILGLILIVIGNGLYTPNSLALLGKSYYKNPKLLDPGIQLYHSGINIGAFLGGFFITMIGDYNYKTAFICSGFSIVISILIIHFFLKIKASQIEKNVELTPLNKYKRVKKILFMIIVSIILYNVKDIIEMIIHTNPLLSNNDSSSSSFYKGLIYSTFDSSSSLIFTLISLLFWSYFYVNQTIKLTIAAIFTFLAVALCLFAFSNLMFINPFVFLIIYLLLINLAHVHLSPLIYSTIIKNTNPKYLTTALTITSAPLWFVLNIVTGYFFSTIAEKDSTTHQLELLGILLIIALIGLGLIVFNVRKRIHRKNSHLTN